MSEWWTYTLSDFLLFSPRVYYRLIELHNRALWPAHVVTLSLGLASFLALLRRARASDRLVPAILGVLWIWIAWAYFWERYASINWASAYVAPPFALQGLLLVGVGGAGRLSFGRASRPDEAIGVALLAFGIIGYPVLAPLMGRPLTAAEVFGIAPDPTAVATLGVLAAARGGTRWVLMIIPALWCVVTGATLWTLRAGEFVAPLAVLAAIAVAASLRR